MHFYSDYVSSDSAICAVYPSHEQTSSFLRTDVRPYFILMDVMYFIFEKDNTISNNFELTRYYHIVVLGYQCLGSAIIAWRAWHAWQRLTCIFERANK